MNNKTNEKRFKEILKQMDNIPDERKAVNEANLLWFLRAGSLHNHTHPRFQESVYYAKQLLNEMDS